MTYALEFKTHAWAHGEVAAGRAVTLQTPWAKWSEMYGMRDEAGVWYSFTYGFSPVPIRRTDPFLGWIYDRETAEPARD